MARFTTDDGTGIDYLDRGTGRPVVLLHGFAADRVINWERPGVVDALVDAGFRVIAPDARGHGASDKPHDPAAYDGDVMVRDVIGLFDHLSLPRSPVVGYSMGSLTTLGLAGVEPRVQAAVLGGVGDRFGAERPRRGTVIAEALEAPDPSSVDSAEARAFRAFADATGADRLALAAIQRSRRSTAADLSAITVPVLVLTGDADTLVGRPEGLAERIPGAKAKLIGGDHLGAVLDKGFIPSIVEFLTNV